MDPNACWFRLVDAIQAGDEGEAEAAAHDLAVWIAGGGFVPHGLAVAIVAERNTAVEISLADLNRALKID
jgi:hypothetical protein